MLRPVFVLRMLRVTRTVTLVPVDTHSQDQETGVLPKYAGLQFSSHTGTHRALKWTLSLSSCWLAGLRPPGEQGKQLTAPLPTSAA